MAETFLKDNSFLDADAADDDLTMGIISYIQDNLHSEITLQDVADHLGYSYFYISKRIRQVFNVPFDEVTSKQRSDAKAVNFGIVYGIGSFSLSQDIGITKKEADKYIEG